MLALRQNMMGSSMPAKHPSPTKLSMQRLVAEGYQPFVVEYYAYGRKHDLFGFADILACKKDEALLVQTTSYSNIPARVKKITEHPNVSAVRDAGFRIVVEGWRLKDGVWISRQVDLS